MKTQLWMLDYGYKVKVLEGKNKEKVGYIVMDSRFGDVGINTTKKPDRNYQIREQPSNLEIISLENIHNIKSSTFSGLSNFDCAKLMLLINNPKMILENQKYFDKQIIESAELSAKTKQIN